MNVWVLTTELAGPADHDATDAGTTIMSTNEIANHHQRQQLEFHLNRARHYAQLLDIKLPSVAAADEVQTTCQQAAKATADKSAKPKTKAKPTAKAEANGESKTPKERPLLRKPQVRILQELAKVKSELGGLNRTELAERSKVAATWVVGYVGAESPESRTRGEALHGYTSLITLGFAKDKKVEVEGKKERLFQITVAGRKHLEKLARS